MDAYTSVELVHLAILKDAAEIANADYAATDWEVKLPTYQTGRFKAPPHRREGYVFGQLFRADPVQSTKGGLTLSIDPFIFQQLDSEQQQRLREIGKEAIRKSLVKNKRLFVGLILGEARQGRNYFDRFDPPAQLRLL